MTGITFDGNGNPTTYKSATFSFDPEDRLTAISSPAFSAAYSGDGLRARKTANGVTTYFVYDGDTPIASASAPSPPPLPLSPLSRLSRWPRRLLVPPLLGRSFLNSGDDPHPLCVDNAMRFRV